MDYQRSDDFAGGIVFVGPTAAGLTQPLATAAGSVFPHEVQAAMLGTIFNESNMYQFKFLFSHIIIFLWN